MKKIEKLPKWEYEKAKQIVSEYEAQFSLSFVKGHFSINDLEIYSESISVPKLTEKIFDERCCCVLEQELNKRVNGVEWANTDDMGHLVISFYRRTVTDEDIKAVIDSLNAL
jgi:hypothetical protein